MFRIYFFIVLMFWIGCKQNNKSDVILLKKIEDLQNQSRKISDTLQIKSILEKGISLSNQIKNDTLKISYKRKITCEYYNHNLFKNYFLYSNENLKDAIKVNDSVNIAKLYYDIGDYYQNVYQIDSAYYYYRKALPYYKTVNRDQILTNYELARLLCKENLNLESEVIIFQNLRHAINYGDPEIIQNFYTIQGINYFETQQYDEALETFSKGFFYIDKIEKELINNIKEDYKAQFYFKIGNVYLKKKNYPLASKNFQLSLKTLGKYGNQLILGYTLLKIEELNIIQNKPININNCLKVLEISETNNIQENIVNAKHLLAKIAFKNNDTTTAFKYMNEAASLSKELRLNLIILELYKTLSKNDLKNKLKWLEKIIDLKDEILKQERLTKNKFAKINYDTENVIQKAKKLEKKINYVFLFLGFLVLVTLLIFYLNKRKTSLKIKKLDNLQKKANLEVYDLLVEQLDLVEKGKNIEKSRISKELHDGIASDLYSLRLSAEMDFIKNVNYKDNLIKISENLKNLEKNVRNLSHDLVNFSLSPNKLIQLIEDLVSKHQYNNSYRIFLKFNEAFYNVIIPNHLKINLYRIIQESLTNIDKYAQAKNVKVFIELKEKNLFLTIKDDGTGFNTLKIKNGIGLKNMNERTKESFGIFRVFSKPFKGTTIQCLFELKELNNI